MSAPQISFKCSYPKMYLKFELLIKLDWFQFSVLTYIFLVFVFK